MRLRNAIFYKVHKALTLHSNKHKQFHASDNKFESEDLKDNA